MVRCATTYAVAAILCIGSVKLLGQGPGTATPPTAVTSPDYSKQAVVIENARTAARFESDGTASQEVRSRIRVQSDAGVQALGLLTFGYNTAFERLHIAYVRVIKPDGTQITTEANAIQDLPSEVQRIAPEYTDFREKHINVPALRPGDILEYALKTEAFAPILPGQFAASYSFSRANIVLHEEIELDFPADRKVNIKFAPESRPTIREENGRRIYLWSHANSVLPDPVQMADDEAKPPDIRVSTFRDWSEVARWYATLQAPKLTVTDAIRAKAAELTASLKTDDEKIAAIYNYVATNIRYVSISFGVGRFQPHHAAEVLGNQYGDCKDKHTLLAALLAAAGFRADPVLISAGARIDPDMPSPFQFNHVITVIPRGSSSTYADTTTEVAPLGYLIEPLRNQRALRVESSGSGELITTPSTLPKGNFERIDVDARLSASGRLEADIATTAAGDPELLWRSILRRTPEAQWPQLLKAVVTSSGMNGELSEVSASNLSDTNKPFELKYHLVKEDYVDWSAQTQRLDLPILKLGIRPAATPEQRKGPIKQNENYAIERNMRLHLPAGVTVFLPISTQEKADFAEYEARYRIENKNLLTASRVYRMTMAEIPRSRYKEFNRIYDAVNADEDQVTTFETSKEFAASLPKKGTEEGGSTAAESVDDLLSQGTAALSSGKFDDAERIFQKVTARDPSNADAWVLLGRVYSSTRLENGHGEKAVEAFQRAVASNPHHQNAWILLGVNLEALGRYSEAAEAFRKQMELTPERQGLNVMLGDALLHAHRPAEAIPALEKSVNERSDAGFAKLQLARAYIETGDQEKGMLTLEAAVKQRPGPMSRSAAAGMLADEGVDLDWAEQQIQQALASGYEALKKTNFEFAGEQDVDRSWKLIHLWETAGWVYFKRGDLQRAQNYLEAAWSWEQFPVTADHLAQLYLKQGRKEDAIKVWAVALANGTHIMHQPDVNARFLQAVGDRQRAERLLETHRLGGQQLRTIEVPNTSKSSGMAEVYVLVAPGPKIVALSISDGDAKMQKFEASLKKAAIPLRFPDATLIQVVRSGSFSCSSMTPNCTLVLKPAPWFHKVRNDDF